MGDNGGRRTIKRIVFDTVRETGGNVDYEELTRRVTHEFPNSAWKKTHWSYYKTQIAHGRYSSEFPEAIRAKLASGRAVRLVKDGKGKVTTGPGRARKTRVEAVYPNLLDDEAHLGIALTLANVAHHVHPDVVGKVQELNVRHADELRSMLPPEINADEYLYPGSACVFPGVRRAVGTFGRRQKEERNKYNPKNRAIVDQNIWPRYFWTYLTLGRGYGGPAWQESGLDQFELAHIFAHKPGERSLEAEVFEGFDENVRPWGLFTCASNIVLVPRGLAKPTDHLRVVRLVFFKRAIDLYGESILPGVSGFREDRVPGWYEDLDWNEPVLPEGWEARMERLHKYRLRRLSQIFGNPV